MYFNHILSAFMTVAPLTGDEGFGGIIAGVAIGAILLVGFVALSVIQKQRKQKSDEEE